MQSLQQQLTSSQSESGSFKRQLAEVTNKLTTSTSNSEQLQQQLSQLKDQLTSQISKTDSLQEQLTKQENSASDLQAQLAEQKSLVSEASNSSKTKTMAIVALALLSVVLAVVSGLLATSNVAAM